MIVYQRSGIYYILHLFQTAGSVFPSALIVALPCALLTGLMRHFINTGLLGYLEDEDSVLKETQAWSGFSFLVGFLIVFRTSQAYSRFWDGCTETHRMRAEWYDAASALISFTRHSKEPREKVDAFKGTLIRLFSMLHAVALAEVEDEFGDMEPEDVRRAFDATAMTYDLVDPSSIDRETLAAIRRSHSKAELIFSWIQGLIVENISTGVLSIPPPILSRAFQELANGMVAFHDALKISRIPFPFPYAQTCDCLLMMHWLVVPFVTAQWVTEPVWATIFSFTQVFILWCLNFIAVEIENPFGTDSNDIDGRGMQNQMNRDLLLLVSRDAQRLPKLESGRALSTLSEPGRTSTCGTPLMSFLEIWDRDESSRGQNGAYASAPGEARTMWSRIVSAVRLKPAVIVNTAQRASRSSCTDSEPKSQTSPVNSWRTENFAPEEVGQAPTPPSGCTLEATGQQKNERIDENLGTVGPPGLRIVADAGMEDRVSIDHTSKSFVANEVHMKHNDLPEGYSGPVGYGSHEWELPSDGSTIPCELTAAEIAASRSGGNKSKPLAMFMLTAGPQLTPCSSLRV